MQIILKKKKKKELLFKHTVQIYGKTNSPFKDTNI